MKNWNSILMSVFKKYSSLKYNSNFETWSPSFSINIHNKCWCIHVHFKFRFWFVLIFNFIFVWNICIHTWLSFITGWTLFSIWSLKRFVFNCDLSLLISASFSFNFNFNHLWFLQICLFNDFLRFHKKMINFIIFNVVKIWLNSFCVFAFFNFISLFV